MDLRTRLEHTLGTAYTINRELSGSGMSHVFAEREHHCYASELVLIRNWFAELKRLAPRP